MAIGSIYLTVKCKIFGGVEARWTAYSPVPNKRGDSIVRGCKVISGSKPRRGRKQGLK